LCFGWDMALSVSRLGQGQARKPGPRSPTCRELTYPRQGGSLASPPAGCKWNHVGSPLLASNHEAQACMTGLRRSPRSDR
jgi:hypothetical protein